MVTSPNNFGKGSQEDSKILYLFTYTPKENISITVVDACRNKNEMAFYSSRDSESNDI